MQSVAVFVFGDIGRSPRMQFHSLQLSKHYHVYLIGYKENAPYSEVVNNNNIEIIDISSKFVNWLKLIKIYYVYAILRIIVQILQLLYLFVFGLKKIRFVLIQNPPSIPVLSTIWIASLFKSFKIVIDFHNYGYTILKMNVKNKFIVNCAERYEKYFAKKSHFQLCVSNNMRENLKASWGLDAITLYDRPDSKVIKINRFQMLNKIGIKDIQKNNFIIVSSTSWTKDEDFSILLKALQYYNTIATENMPFIYTFITGKGPEKENYLKYMEETKSSWKKIEIKTLWLESGDYPRLLAACDIGVCLHYSSSGLDLPMKVVDMFNAGLPVLAINYQTIRQLVKQNINGLIFKNSGELFELIKLLLKDSTLINKLRDGVKEQKNNSFDKEWRNKFSNIIASI